MGRKFYNAISDRIVSPCTSFKYLRKYTGIANPESFLSPFLRSTFEVTEQLLAYVQIKQVVFQVFADKFKVR
jgi:hypothetical protein